MTYQLIYSTDPNFAVAQTVVDVAAAKTAGLLFAGLGSMGGGIMLFGFVAGNGSRRSRTTTLGIIALILVGALITACDGGGGGGTPTTPADQQVSKTVTGLAPNTTYFWKVVANDGKGGLATSTTFSFKTQ
ncbi:MAG: fibronectin type III domain-containing protein [Verrucomicrobia bacterium]|nr:fibronectin type III domain-containing protein [Deltaproteobacteria bacterium]